MAQHRNRVGVNETIGPRPALTNARHTKKEIRTSVPRSRAIFAYVTEKYVAPVAETKSLRGWAGLSNYVGPV